MQVQQQTTYRPQNGERGKQTENPSAWVSGWAMFAGVIMILVGIFQAFQGLAAILNSNFFFIGPNYTYSIDVSTWGWIHLILGAIVAIAGFSVFSGQMWARVIGIVLAMLSATVNFFFIPYYPIWSILIIVMDIGIIWGLASFSGKRRYAM